MENCQLKEQTEALEFKAHSEAVNGCKYLLDDRAVSTCSDDGTVGFWSTSNGDNLLTMNRHARAVKAIDINEERHHILSVSWDKSAILQDYHTEQKLWSVSHESMCTSCHSNANMAAVGCNDNAFYLWDLRFGDIINDSKNKQGHTNTITSCQFSHDGVFLCTTSMDRSSLVWDIRTMKPLLKLEGHINVVSSCSFSSSDHYICTSSWDKTIRLYDVSTGGYRNTGGLVIKAHNGCVSNCKFSQDDSLLVSCGYDCNVVMHNMRSGGRVCLLKGDNSWIHDVNISKNKKWLLTCSNNGFVKVWDTDADDLVNKKTAVGLEMSKCEQCGRFIVISDMLTDLCVFCRIESPQRSLEQKTVRPFTHDNTIIVQKLSLVQKCT